MVTGLALRITRQAVPQLWPLTRLPRLGDPSEPSLAPQTVELLAPCSPTLHQTLPRAPPEPHRSTLDPDRGYYGEAPVRLRWGYGDEREVGGAVPPPITLKMPIFILSGISKEMGFHRIILVPWTIPEDENHASFS
jgi:hypothetical protein